MTLLEHQYFYGNNHKRNSRFSKRQQSSFWELGDDLGQNFIKDELWVSRLGSTDH